MAELPTVVVLLITYKRTDCAKRVINSFHDNIIYPSTKIHWHITDDGSSEDHRWELIQTLHERWSGTPTITNAQRRGVGRSMNMGADAAFARSDFVLWLEDDWELDKPFDLRPCVQLLLENSKIGMIRLGYMSPGLDARLISGAGHLWWSLRKGPQYTFTGHASLRHARFYQYYHPYKEGLAPGETELWMCGRFNHTDGPEIVIPSWTGPWGPFAHIGTESLKDVKPG